MLKVEKLSTFYGNIQALRDVTIRVKRGSITTIIGANGAGKTTLLRTISGLNRARHGLVIYEDKDVTNLRADQASCGWGSPRCRRAGRSSWR